MLLTGAYLRTALRVTTTDARATAFNSNRTGYQGLSNGLIGTSIIETEEHIAVAIRLGSRLAPRPSLFNKLLLKILFGERPSNRLAVQVATRRLQLTLRD